MAASKRKTSAVPKAKTPIVLRELAETLVKGLGFEPGKYSGQVSFVHKNGRGVDIEVIAQARKVRINCRDALSATALKKVGVQPVPARVVDGKKSDAKPRWAAGFAVTDENAAQGRQL